MQPVQSADGFLQDLVAMVNSGEGIPFTITVSVGGVIVSGTLVPIDEYFLGVAQEFGADTADVNLEPFRKFFEEYAEPGVVARSLPEEIRGQPAMIHLKDALILHTSGQTIPTNRSIYWRGLLSRIDAFWFGRLSSEPLASTGS